MKATPLSATCPRHLPCSCRTLTPTCPRTFKTAVCPASNPSKRFRRPPRQQLLQLLHAPAICFSGGSRLPFARPQTPQTLPTLPQASKATTLTATCPCHLLFRGFKTAVCPPSNPPNASNAPACLQGNNSYSYMSPNPPNASNPLAGLPGPAICFSGGSRLPFARPQTPQTLPTLPQASKATTLTATCPQTLQTLPTLSQASKATTLTATCPCHLFFRGFKTAVCPPSNPPNASNAHAGKATTLTATCPCHLFFRGFKTAVCPPSNPPNASNAPAGLQGNNSYSRTPPRQQLLQLLHAPAICFSGGSRLPFARPQTLQTLPTPPQASKATTLTATCPCHLFFTGFKTAVCPASNVPNASNPPAGLQGNNSYSYMPLPSVFQGVQDCRRKQRHTPSRQHLCQLHAQPSTCSCRTLTPTCPCHLFFRTFKTAVCPASNPPNASAGLQGTNAPAGLQGNNSYSYMPLPSVFQGVQACRLPALKPPKRFQPSRRPPRQQLLQLHVPKPSKRFQPSRRPPRPCHLFFTGFKTAVCPPSNPPNASNPPAGLQGNNSYSYMSPNPPNVFQPSRRPPRPCHLFFRGFKTAVCPPSNPPNASNAPAGLQGNNSYSYMPSNPPNASNPPAGLQGNNSYSYMPLPSVFQGVQDCRLPALKPPKRFQRSRRPPRQQLLQLHAPAICCSGGSRLPFARPQTLQTLPTPPQASKANNSYSRTPPRQQLLQLLHAPAICFSGGSRLPFARPQTPQTLPQASKAPAICFSGVQDCRLPALKPPKRFRKPPKPSRTCPAKATTLTATCPQTPQTLPTLPQASKATTLTATTCPCHLFFRGFKTAVCPPSNPPNPPAGLQGNNSYSYMPSNPNASNPPAGLQGNNSYSYYMPLPSVFPGVQDCRLPGLKPPKPSRKPPKPSRRPPSKAPAICFSRGSRLPFARPQTPKPPKPSRRPPRQQLLQLHALKPRKRFQPSRRPPRQQLLQLLHAPAICFSGGSRLPFARPQTPQTLPQASKATTLTATCPQTPQTLPTLPQASKATTLTATTCPCHLFFRGFKTAVCPASNPPNSNPTLTATTCPCHLFFTGFKTQFARPQTPPRQQLLQLQAPAICFSRGSRLPFARPQTPQTLPTLPQASKATTLTATTCPCHLFFRGFKTAVCPPSNPPNPSNPPAGLQGLHALKPPKRFQPSRRPPRQQLLQLLHAPAICFSGGSRLPFARPQTPINPPYYFKTAVCSASNPPNASNPPAGLQGNNSYSYYMPLPSVFQGVQDCAGLQGNNSYSYMPLPSVFQGVHGLQEPVIHRLFWGFCSGTNHFVFLHGFPAGVSWLT